MTIPNLGNIDINAYVAILKRARDTGKAILGNLREELKGNPDIKAVIDLIEGLIRKPVTQLTDAELKNLIASWHTGNQAKSKPFPQEPVDPIDPPPPVTFPYDKELNWHPLADDLAHLLVPTDRIYRRKDGSTGWIVNRVGAAAPPDAGTWELDATQPPA